MSQGHTIPYARASYPFSAIVGQDEMKLALILTAVDPSIGGVLVPDDCGSVQQILAKADVAMYRAKATKRSALVFYCSLDEQSNAFSA